MSSQNSTIDNLAFKLARRRVRSYADESTELMRRHAEAMECRDCEDFLQIGIDAYKWIRRAEETMREADYEGFYDFNSETQESMSNLYEIWMNPCEFAATWIAALESRGYSPDNLDEFRLAHEDVRSIVECRDWQSRTTNARVLNTSSEPW